MFCNMQVSANMNCKYFVFRYMQYIFCKRQFKEHLKHVYRVYVTTTFEL